MFSPKDVWKSRFSESEGLSSVDEALREENVAVAAECFPERKSETGNSFPLGKVRTVMEGESDLRYYQ